MLEPQPAVEKGELARLHAATCLAMTRFINGHQCPKLAQIIVRQLNLLLTHPDLDPVSNTRDMYLQMLDHWQKITLQLLEPRQDGKAAVVYH